MILKSLSLQNFRNYKKSEVQFKKDITLIIGPNTSGKTNLLEAIFLLSIGKSFRAEKDLEVVRFGENLARVKGKTDKDEQLEVVLARDDVSGRLLKKYLANGVSKKREDFVGGVVCVLFSPTDLSLITNSPSLRRGYLDFVLEQVDRKYRLASTTYDKALKARNRLLDEAKKEGIRDEKRFDYWDNLLIENGEIITSGRSNFIDFVNREPKDIFDFSLFYDKSLISKERLSQYEQAEIEVGATLVGPHRDEVIFKFKIDKELTAYGSRGEQRLTILQLKLLELDFIEKRIGERPILLLDDIFSELDSEHIHHVLKIIGRQQTIVTTTHQEFVSKPLLKQMNVIELG